METAADVPLETAMVVVVVVVVVSACPEVEAALAEVAASPDVWPGCSDGETGGAVE